MHKIEIKFNLKFLLILLLIELITVPLVAESNPWLQHNLFTVLGFGFFIAAFGIALLLRIIKNYLIDNSVEIFTLKVNYIQNLWLVIVLAGVLEMVMFAIQDVMFSHQINVFVVGFFSAFGSVLSALLVYKVLLRLFKIAIVLGSDNVCYKIDFLWLDIVYLSFLFGIYEFIVCPITGWWIPYSGIERLVIAIASAVIGAISGFSLLLLVKNVLQKPVYFVLQTISPV